MNVPLEILTKREVEVEVDDRNGRRPENIRVNTTVQQSRGEMFDGSGRGREYETRTTISTIPMGRKSESGSR